MQIIAIYIFIYIYKKRKRKNKRKKIFNIFYIAFIDNYIS